MQILFCFHTTLKSALLVLVVAVLLWASPLRAAPPSPACERIVSLAPSITETLFALDLGGQMKGVTRYCVYPQETRDIDKVGGLFDINVEKIVSLKPSKIFALSEHRQISRQLEALGFDVQTFDHRSVAGILQSILEVGHACNVEEKAGNLRRALEERMEAVQVKAAGKPPVRTMVVVGGELEGKGVARVYLSGKDGFYADLLKMAGGVNVYEGSTAGLPSLSREGILHLNPDVIIQVAPLKEGSGDTAESFNQAWSEFSELRAVRNHKVFVLQDYVDTIPGPRFVEVLEKIAAKLHPELFESATAQDSGIHLAEDQDRVPALPRLP